MNRTKYKFKDILSVINGSTPSTQRPDFYDGNIIWITPKDLSNDKVKYISKSDRYITKSGYESCSTSILPIGSILLSSRAPIGLLAIAKKELCTNQGFKNLIVNQKYIDNEYLYYWLKTKIDYISSLGTGTTFKEVSKSVIEDLEIILPENTLIQQKIAKVLSDLDAKIELNNKINAELEAMAKTLYDYWFVQFDFPDANGKPYKSSGGKMVWNEELKREIPEGWEVGTLDSIGDIIGGSTPSKAIDENFCYDEGTAWITPKDLSNNKGKKFITRGEYDVTACGIKEASLKIIPTGTVLLSSRAPIGYLAIARKNVTTNQGFKSFVPKNGFSSEYIYYTIQNQIPEIEANSSGSTFKEVSSSTLKTIKTILPKDEILLAFDILIKPIFKKQDCQELGNQELASLRDWLLPMLMNGQVSVGDDLI
jgi:type I restriction enzyme S subunit